MIYRNEEQRKLGMDENEYLVFCLENSSSCIGLCLSAARRIKELEQLVDNLYSSIDEMNYRD